ncbi:MAG: cation transporter, partial [Gammaproteobacteria bacterium]|nr:cation transporter [Gammaproteobacteria bacterium]
GMTCQHCVANVRRAIESQGKFDLVLVDQVSGMVQVAGAAVQREPLVKAVADAGYRVVDGEGE